MNDPPSPPQYELKIDSNKPVARKPSTTRVMLWIVAGLFVLGVCMILSCTLMAISAGRNAANRARRNIQAREVFLEVMRYEDTYGKSPLFLEKDAQGNSLHSWRTIFLADPHYSQYDRTQPWNTGGNGVIAQTKLDRLISPGQSITTNDAGYGVTNYVMVVDKETHYPDREWLTIFDDEEQAHLWVMFVEILDSDIAWAEPRDMAPAEFMQRARQGSSYRGPNRFANDCLIVVSDGRIRHYSLDELRQLTMKTIRLPGERPDSP